MDKFYYKSAIGLLEIIYKNDELISLKLVDKIGISCPTTNFIKNIILQLDEYFLGRRQKFDVAINPTGTNFQKKVWAELLRIPYGKTKSYQEIANAIGNPNSQRAVGAACNRNPILLIIPCHRVILKNGNVGGFVYGNQIKQKLLEIESRV